MAAGLEYITADELVNKLTGPEKAKTLVVDVRGEDFEGGHIKGAVNVPSEDFEANVVPVIEQQLDGIDTIVVHCALSQVRGPKCAHRLKSLLSEADLQHKPDVKVLSKGFNGFQRQHGDNPNLVEQ